MQRTGVYATVLSGVLFGTSVPVIKLGLSQALIPPILFVGLRFLFASAFIFLVLRRTWVNPALFRSKPMWLVGIVNMVGYVTQFKGQVLATASDAALIIGTAALMIPIISQLHGSERLTTKRSLGVLLGFAGTTLVVTRGEALSLGQDQLAGDLLILGTAVTIALIFVVTKDLVRTRGSSAVTGGLILTTTLLLLPLAPFDLTSPAVLGLDAWLYILFLSLVSTIGAYYFFAKGLESVTPTVSSIILPIEVIVSVSLSVLIFRDPFNLFSGTGAVLIVLGVILVSLSS